MRQKSSVIAMVVALLGVPILADDVLYRYEPDVLPYDESAGWDIFDPCEGFCAESIENDHFVLTWIDGGDLANYHLWIAQPPDAPPLALGRVALPIEPAFRWDLLHLRRTLFREVRRHARARLHVR